MTRVACAIYTRKSSEEGLEKEFNSLDAQREACAAYTMSQKHAGWVAVQDLYDDGGLSGGTMERPALKRLLADIMSGKVQIVVVYKVDRLTRAPSLLSGLIFDGDGNRMTPTHANKRGRRYRYYISASLLGRGSVGPNTMRVPAGEVEGLVVDQILQLIGSRQRLADALMPLGLAAEQLEQALRVADDVAMGWHSAQSTQQREWVRRIVSRVALHLDQIEVSICTSSLAATLGCRHARAAGSQPMLVLPVEAKLQRSGKGKRMVIGDATAKTIDPVLVRLIQEAFAIRAVVLSETTETLNEITARRKKSKGYLTALMRLSCLAPQIVDDILDGRQPPELSAKQFLRTSGSLPLEWQAQRVHLRFARAASRD